MPIWFHMIGTTHLREGIILFTLSISSYRFEPLVFLKSLVPIEIVSVTYVPIIFPLIS